MEKTTFTKAKQLLGNWLPQDPQIIENWTLKLKEFTKKNPTPLIPEIVEFQNMVYSDPVLYANVQGMFAEAHFLKQSTPLPWEPEPVTFEDFLVLLNGIMQTAPEAYQTGAPGNQSPAGMIGFPINALLAWPMATNFGYDVFSNALVNQQLKKILNYWSKFLVSEDSRYVLIENDPSENVIAWLSELAQSEMMEVAKGALGLEPNPIPASATFSDVFQSNPSDPYYGFKSWDDFFTRLFCANVRPVTAPNDDSIIVNACESAPLQVAKNVALSDQFWLKGQPYSLENMLNFDELTPQFAGGTVYQAFLSALSYHRWHSPVNGRIVKTAIVNGTYYLENLYQGFYNPQGPDSSAPNNSQAFLTAVATRALIFIEADNPAIGLMCVMPVGMAEVSSCEITVKAGDIVKKGDQLGMFHFGGSTHCLFFRPGVNLEFSNYENPGLEAPNNIRVNTQIFKVV
ncbi:phosphatidylserine decarboxylase family protein [Flavobacterium sp. DG2-3]|uniref:phosphatidylserine decarboxylase family protein n=1 Tax=Flavobacterium sp. DG2-3 TaxID=3068317 RepID=UPI00273EDC42|nr:phosphatidylserine decarboxylase family protein [Flavobacterium sp. DG2-3]MDP5199712.1 phophatidylserine decarboxylase associated domain-containing protein [Flavobacterium sp. DG2-3]